MTSTIPMTEIRILCCVCGTSIAPNPSNTCPSCLASKADVTKGIQTEVTLHQCRGCQRWHLEAGKWMACELESRELMSLCLSNVSGLHHSSSKTKSSHSDPNVRLVDAAWIWTEPHSMRLKVRLTVQKQVQTGTILQQSFTVEFIVRNQQCIECQSEFRTGSWKTVIQVRQRVKHKRTFLYLEQLILKHGAHRGCLSIEAFKDGMDFYFAERNKAAKFQTFLENVVPMQVKCSKKLIGMDDRNNVANYKYTHFVEIVPLCKDDLLYLPLALAKSLGNISRLVLVKNISEVVHVIDPLTCQTAQFSADVYWRHESSGDLRPIITANRSRFTSFIVLGKDPIVVSTTTAAIQDPSNNPKRRRDVLVKRRNHRMSKLAALTVAREEDLGVNDHQLDTISHMGYLMKSGDTVIGYDLTKIQFVNDEAEEARSSGLLPSIVILRKLYSVQPMSSSSEPVVNKSKSQRMFSLQKLDVDHRMEEDVVTRHSKSKKGSMDVDEDDEEEFLRQVEADREMRANMNLYKRGETVQGDATLSPSAVNMDNDDDDDSDDQRVRLEELLDGLALDDGPDAVDINLDVNDNGLLAQEEGTRATRDGITYVGREDSRRVQNKDVARAVSQFGQEFK